MDAMLIRLRKELPLQLLLLLKMFLPQLLFQMQKEIPRRPHGSVIYLCVRRDWRELLVCLRFFSVGRLTK